MTWKTQASDAGADVPDVYDTNYRIKITASDGQIDTTIIGQDGAPMVLIPAGEFQMGDHLNEGSGNEFPVHTVYLDAFYMDIYAVTNAQYQIFMDATGRSAPDYWSDLNYNAPDHPVVGVSWHDAVAYAAWAGKRLPTEAEWEKAGRGGLTGKRYPWGDEISSNDANSVGTDGEDVWDYTSPVGSFAPNGYGLYDMAGNVWEWCSNWYSGSFYANSPQNNPLGAALSLYRILRGGPWGNSLNSLRVADRYGIQPSLSNSYAGFRCVSQD